MGRRVGVLWFLRIVDDQNIAAATGQRTTDRGGIAESTARGLKLGLGILLLTNARSRKYCLVAIAAHEDATVVGVLSSKTVGIAATENTCGWVMSQNIGRQGY